MQEFFKKEPRRDINPDEAVAMGAAIQAAVLSGDVKDVLLLDVTPLSLGIETLGGMTTNLIERNTTIPVKKNQIFSTADDNQPAVTIHVLQGERKRAMDNKSLGKFDLTDLPLAPRGIPQIDVSFDIDANGILHVSATDKKSGKEQSIRIQASGGLEETEIDRMVKEAEAHADDDAEFEKLVAVRNTGDILLNATRKAFEKHKDELTEEQSKETEGAIKDLEEAIAGDDKDALEQKIKELSEKSAPLTELAAKQAESDSANQGDNASSDAASGAAAGAGPAEDTDASNSDSGVKDASFEEVQDDRADAADKADEAKNTKKPKKQEK